MITKIMIDEKLSRQVISMGESRRKKVEDGALEMVTHFLPSWKNKELQRGSISIYSGFLGCLGFLS